MSSSCENGIHMIVPPESKNINENPQKELVQCKKDIEKLLAEEQRFQFIAEHAPIGLTLIDKGGNFCYSKS